MNFYDNAVDVHETAEILYENGKYRMSVYNSCLAMELYLKSKLILTDDGVSFELSHDVINIFRCINKKFPSSKELFKTVNYCRKYFNESRYPAFGTEVYTNEFASEFLGYVEDIKNYIDNECIITDDDLKKKFNRKDK